VQRTEITGAVAAAALTPIAAAPATNTAGLPTTYPLTGDPDGSNFTNSNAPQVFRVAEHDGERTVTTWADATGAIETRAGFNLGGIVLAPNRRSFVVAQCNAGVLRRFDIGSRQATAVETGAIDLPNADGLVSRGRDLYLVRNFDRILTTVRLSDDATTATLVAQRPTDPDRVLTTAKLVHGRLLAVDSKFDEPTATAPYEIITPGLR
jgi:hypothetical protein